MRHAYRGEELVTSALRHGAGAICIRLSSLGRELRAGVHDKGAGCPVRRHPRASDEPGRGLEVTGGLIRTHGGLRGCIDDGASPGKTACATMYLTRNAAGAS
jgi:hypothetical protein